ncbi:MAG: acyl-CoA dehydrogenase family protein [Myxococcota bacterium]
MTSWPSSRRSRPAARCSKATRPTRQALWKRARRWAQQGAVIPESFGGAGFGHLGRDDRRGGQAGAGTDPFGPSVYLATEALLRSGSPAQQKSWLPRLADGSAIGCFAFAERPGQNAFESVEAKVSGESSSPGTKKLPVGDGDVASLAIVAAQDGSRVGLHLVDLSTSGVTRTPLESFDPSRSQAKLVFEGAACEPLAGTDAAAIAKLLDVAAVLQAFEQVSAATRVPRDREFVLGRCLGKPIAATEGGQASPGGPVVSRTARSNAYYAAWALSNDNPETIRSRALAPHRREGRASST